jgi:formylglycine-generating enzyme required for sulfatase activity
MIRSGAIHLNYNHALADLKNIPDARVCGLPTFYIACYPLTHAQADVLFESPLRHQLSRVKRGSFSPRSIDPEPADFPEHFNWEEADLIAHWLGGRLPTVAEWETAARGTDGRLYPWGNDWNPAFGNFDVAAGFINFPKPRKWRGTPVDAYPEGGSPYGVRDMCGNLGEWTATVHLFNEPIYKPYGNRVLPGEALFFWSLPSHQYRGAFTDGQYVGVRPILTEWGKHLWPGFHPEFD